MGMTDPIADLLTRIRNAQQARHEIVTLPSSNIKKAGTIASCTPAGFTFTGLVVQRSCSDGVVP